MKNTPAETTLVNQDSSGDDITTIRIKKRVRDELSKLGSYNETMSDIIERCIETYKKFNKK
jgi:predicted CopG family antitoxin